MNKMNRKESLKLKVQNSEILNNLLNEAFSLFMSEGWQAQIHNKTQTVFF